MKLNVYSFLVFEVRRKKVVGSWPGQWWAVPGDSRSNTPLATSLATLPAVTWSFSGKVQPGPTGVLPLCLEPNLSLTLSGKRF